MLKVQQEQLSSLMDGEQYDQDTIDSILKDDELKQYWRRYHVARDIMQGRLDADYLTFDISDKVAQLIELEDLPDQPTVVEQTTLPTLSKLIWLKTKDVLAKLSQVGLAACVTLGVIGIVQYQSGASKTNDIPVLNTVPIGVNLAPVGGVGNVNNYEQPLDTMSNQQYNKIRMLVQDYELQRRLNVQ